MLVKEVVQYKENLNCDDFAILNLGGRRGGGKVVLNRVMKMCDIIQFSNYITATVPTADFLAQQGNNYLYIK